MGCICSIKWNRSEAIATRTMKALTSAIFANDLDRLTALITEGADLNVKVANKVSTPLIYAAICGREKCVEILLKSGANVNGTNYAGESGVLRAAAFGNWRCMALLIEAGADVNLAPTAFTFAGMTPLHVAAKRGRVNCVKMLIEAGADVNGRTKDDKSTPLHLAALKGYSECVRLLLEVGASVNKKVLKSGVSVNKHVLKPDDSENYAVLTPGGSVNKHVLTPEDSENCAVLSEENNRLMKKALISVKPYHENVNGSEIEVKREKNQTISTEISGINTVSSHTSGCVNIPVVGSDWKNVTKVCEDENLALNTEFFTEGADVNSGGDSNNNVTAVTADVNNSVNNDDSMVIEGANVNNEINSRDLGADVNTTKTMNGLKPYVNGEILRDPDSLIGKSGVHKHRDLSVSLFTTGADVNATDIQGRTSLFQAAYGGNPECVRLLTQRGASVNREDSQGNSPLFASFGNVECATILLTLGARVNTRNHRGLDIFDYHQQNLERFAKRRTIHEVVEDEERIQKMREILGVFSDGDFLIKNDVTLQGLSRGAVRKALQGASPETNLLIGSLRLGIPVTMVSYLLYNRINYDDIKNCANKLAEEEIK